jgi:hypothetical protein
MPPLAASSRAVHAVSHLLHGIIPSKGTKKPAHEVADDLADDVTDAVPIEIPPVEEENELHVNDDKAKAIGRPWKYGEYALHGSSDDGSDTSSSESLDLGVDTSNASEEIQLRQSSTSHGYKEDQGTSH